MPNTDLNGNTPITDLFRPIQTTNTILDTAGNEWKQITATGYLRKIDKFFWPFNPLNNNNIFNQFPPSIEEMKTPKPLPKQGICIDLCTGLPIE